MKKESIEILNTIIAKGGFASKVAQTVLTNQKCSEKQHLILEDAIGDWLDINDFDIIDVTNLKSDPSFDAMQKRAFKNQSVGL